MSRLALAAIAVVFLAGLLFGLIYTLNHQPVTVPGLSPDWVVSGDVACDLHQQACRAVLENGRWVELSIHPRPIEMLTPLQLQVRLGGFEAERVAIDFVGIEMDMGFNRPNLFPLETGHYQGEGILALCTTEAMTWQVTVLVNEQERLGAARFFFDTQRQETVSSTAR